MKKVSYGSQPFAAMKELFEYLFEEFEMSHSDLVNEHLSDRTARRLEQGFLPNPGHMVDALVTIYQWHESAHREEDFQTLIWITAKKLYKEYIQRYE